MHLVEVKLQLDIDRIYRRRMLEMSDRPRAGVLGGARGVKPEPEVNSKGASEAAPTGVESVHLVSATNTTNFYSKILSEFRMKGILCDVVFGFPEEGTQTCAHRVVLACHSDYFRQHFADSSRVYSKEKPCIIDKATSYIFEFMLEFMYSGKIQVPRNAVFDLCKVAHEYQVAELRTLCIRSLSETFNLQTCFQLSATQQSLALPQSGGTALKTAQSSMDTAQPQPEPQPQPQTPTAAPAHVATASQAAQPQHQQLNLLVLAQQALLEKSKYGHDENRAANNLLKKTPRVEGLKRCCVENCKSAARHSSKYCINHGSKICSFENCTTGARGGSKFCVTHGGGRRCAVHNCNTSARGRSKLCILHGGGKRCSIKFCNKSARGGSQKCISHGGGRLCDVATCSKPRLVPGKYCEAHVKTEKAGIEKVWKASTTGVKRGRYSGTPEPFKVLSPNKNLDGPATKRLGRPKRQRCTIERAVLATKNE